MVVGSNPTGPTRPEIPISGEAPAGSVSAVHSGAQPITFEDSINAFILSRQVANCSSRTVEMYRSNLGRFQEALGATTLGHVEPLAIPRYLTNLRDRMKPISAYQHFVCLRAFFSWCVEARLLGEHPMRGSKMRIPKTLPRVPEDETIQRLLAVCPLTGFEGRRNKALVSLLADGGLRISEALRLRIEDVNLTVGVIE